MDRGVTVLSSRIERRQLRPGDHIYAWFLKVVPYSHHGIYQNDDKVIHFTVESGASGFTSFSASSSSSSSSSSFSFCPECRDAMRGGGVVTCCLDCFLEGHDLCLFAYSVPALFCSMSNVGAQDTCSMLPEDPPEVVLYRANDLLTHGFGKYNLALNNCFDFAFYCKTGRRYRFKLEALIDPSMSPRDMRPPRACTIM
ncbi:unnamed protein product [Alopecurus aequalis]